MVLYYLPTCPYCMKVLRFMSEEGISLELADTNVPENRQKLIAVGGKNQVPCLFINGEPLYESNDIIEYLRNNYAR